MLLGMPLSPRTRALFSAVLKVARLTSYYMIVGQRIPPGHLYPFRSAKSDACGTRKYISARSLAFPSLSVALCSCASSSYGVYKGRWIPQFLLHSASFHNPFGVSTASLTLFL